MHVYFFSLIFFPKFFFRLKYAARQAIAKPGGSGTKCRTSRWWVGHFFSQKHS